jgi:hypothetical protein
MANKWWLISSEDVSRLRDLLEANNEALYILITGLHITNEVPDDFKYDQLSTRMLNTVSTYLPYTIFEELNGLLGEPNE